MAANSRITATRAKALERGEVAELFESGIDVAALERTKALHAKALAAEAPHHGAVDDGAAELAAADVVAFQVKSLLGQVADEASGEAIACAGGVEHVLEQISGHNEIGIAAEQHGAVLASLNDERVRTQV